MTLGGHIVDPEGGHISGPGDPERGHITWPLTGQLRHSNLLKSSLFPYPVYVSSFYYLAYIVK